MTEQQVQTPPTAARWDEIVAAVPADALDCLQTGVAVLADVVGGPGAHRGLGARLWFPAPDGTGYAEAADLTARLAQARDELGLISAPPEKVTDMAGLDDRDGPLYVVADAYDLPWLPYAGHEHMSHSFVLARAPEGWDLVDAYHNDTQWGPARPAVRFCTDDQVADLLANGPVLVTTLKSGAVPARPPAPSADGIDAYALAGRTSETAVEQLVLDVWLIERDRRLHLRWLDDHSPEKAEVWRSAGRVEAWQRLAARTYLALRRLRRGHPVGREVVDEVCHQLRMDAELTDTAEPTAIREVVLSAIGESLAIDPSTVATAPTLRDLPGFDSFRLVDALERVERALSAELPDDLGADDLGDVDGLVRLFTRATVRR
ncbi:hypothetical protein [Amycolatopsis alba]|uniref:Phosphopantetheine-binding protein n=1 Tax=Amycolatopsis alba DSM 44262 TaxID=1125972 RepID=A0A229RSS1_AMYAL|nr:hypothetical protein [Amycolatopsis alba]OXM49727.1 phosphopantetheine-binding protein [Amycolatopsis alba DSM 44262]